jgi:hypothetical protein
MVDGIDGARRGAVAENNSTSGTNRRSGAAFTGR